METTGERIRAERVKLGLTLEELASRIGVSAQAVGQWERSESKTLKAGNLVKLARALGRSPDWIITGKDAKMAISEEAYIALKEKEAAQADVLSFDEKLLLTKYRHLSEDDRMKLQLLVGEMRAGYFDETD